MSPELIASLGGGVGLAGLVVTSQRNPRHDRREELGQVRARLARVEQRLAQLEAGQRTLDQGVADGAADGATGLAAVPAVAEAAVAGQRVDVVEDVLERRVGIPQLQLAHAGRVADDARVRQHQRLAAHRERSPKPEGLREGLRDAVTGRRASGNAA